ncbi:MAG: sigma-E processing peptidase SpoIIGA [Oscillospiraceae bacterium]|nr:sigma-E processing peptidase SpoIIGA [Oscillospiraceae bacterium]
MYIYIDVLIITSVYIDFLLIKAAAGILHRSIRTQRCLISALAGSLFSLSVLLPPMDIVQSLLMKLFSAAVIVYAAFGYGSTEQFLRAYAAYFGVSLAFAGICFFLSQTAGEIFLYRNSGVYINISPAVLLISTAVSYAAVRLAARFSQRSGADGTYTVTLRFRYPGGYVDERLKAAADTGNTLSDIITGRPVIVCSRDMLTQLALHCDIPTAEDTVLPRGWRLIPYHTASGAGLLPIVRPESIYIKNDETGRISCADAYIGVSASDMEYAVFDPKLLL